jgi:competence protein ComEA
MNRKESTVLIFLIGVVLVGAGINAVRRARQRAQLGTIALIPAPDSASAPIPDSESRIPQFPAAGLIDLNTATAAELDLLPGIGPALSQRILAYRNAGPGFRSKEDLLKVSGIGPKKYAAIKDRVTVGRTAP